MVEAKIDNSFKTMYLNLKYIYIYIVKILEYCIQIIVVDNSK